MDTKGLERPTSEKELNKEEQRCQDFNPILGYDLSKHYRKRKNKKIRCILVEDGTTKATPAYP